MKEMKSFTDFIVKPAQNGIIVYVGYSPNMTTDNPLVFSDLDDFQEWLAGFLFIEHKDKD